MTPRPPAVLTPPIISDFDPTKHYQLTINSSEMTAIERESQAQSVDDIELNL